MSAAPGREPLSAQLPAVLGLRQQAAVVDDLLRRRLDTLLPMAMREAGLDMWLIICHEDNLDPVLRTMIPWQSWTPILQIVAFYDRGEAGVERLNLSMTDMRGLMDTAWRRDSGEDQWTTLRRIVSERNPKRIGVNMSDVIWAADGLSASLLRRLNEELGPELSARIVSAEKACIRWLETRLPEELELYRQACSLAHAIIAECFSRRVITPGVTTCEDLRWHYWERVKGLGLDVSFTPYFRLFRGPEGRQRWGADDPIIRPGDMLHCDVGLHYLRLTTDHQELAYVLLPGEWQAPAGLRAGMAEANRLQEIFVSCWQEGLSGNEILARALARAREEGLSQPKIYSHSLGHLLHEPGPLMGLPWEQGKIEGRGDVIMHPDTCYTVELSVTRPVPEWDGEEVPFMLEQDAAFTRDGPVFLDGRQTAFHLI
jgi:Xaa-Pro aminopeptidase